MNVAINLNLVDANRSVLKGAAMKISIDANIQQKIMFESTRTEV